MSSCLNNKKELGDCFEANTLVFLDFVKTNPIPAFCKKDIVLCQGLVKGGKNSEVEGLIFPHCWIESGDILLDFSNGKSIITRKEKIYSRIIADSVVCYDKDTLIKLLLKHKHYGSFAEHLTKPLSYYQKHWESKK